MTSHAALTNSPPCVSALRSIANQIFDATECLSRGFGNCCVTLTTELDAHPYDRKDIDAIEELVSLMANHSDYTNLDHGIWEVLDGTYYTQEAGVADPTWVVHGWVAVLDFVREHALKDSGAVGQFIFYRGNAIVGEEKIIIGRKGYYKTRKRLEG